MEHPPIAHAHGGASSQAQEVRDFVVEHDFPGIGRKAMLLNANQIIMADERDPLILLAIEDMTERKRAEEETMRSAEKLASAGRIAATIAHEINNPLDILTSVMYLMEQHPGLDPTSQDLVKRGQEMVRRITSITRQTLGLFSNSSKIQEVAITQLLDETLELLSGKFRERNITVRKCYDVEGLIYAAPTELRQVFTNLLVNALEAISAGGRLALHVFAAHDWQTAERLGIHVVIADSGVGIPHEHQKKIFEPFFTTKGEKGTGLGLYVIRGIVNKYQGTIRLRSSTASGKSGTCFSIFFRSRASQVDVVFHDWHRPRCASCARNRDSHGITNGPALVPLDRPFRTV